VPSIEYDRILLLFGQPLPQFELILDANVPHQGFVYYLGVARNYLTGIPDEKYISFQSHKHNHQNHPTKTHPSQLINASPIYCQE
jgi:hypothetical protein